jgi:predicted DNA-binding transcriptional regulator AlpA
MPIALKRSTVKRDGKTTESVKTRVGPIDRTDRPSTASRPELTPAEILESPSTPRGATKSSTRPPVRFGLRLDEIADAFGVSRRTIERERSTGRFPRPDLHIGKMPIWCPATIEGWIAASGAR